jgi:hypothetical protein
MRQFIRIPFDVRPDGQVIGSELGERSGVNLDFGPYAVRDDPNVVEGEEGEKRGIGGPA